MSSTAPPSIGALPASSTFFESVRDGALVAAMLLAVVGQALPYGFPLFLPFALLALSLAMLCRGWNTSLTRTLVPLDAFGGATLLAFLPFLYGILLTRHMDASLAAESLNAVGIMVLYAAAINTIDSPLAWRRFSGRLLRFATVAVAVIALLGLYKFLLLLRGKQIGFVADASAGGYPWGTSLVTDYNMFALVMLFGLIATCSALLGARTFTGRFVTAGLVMLLFGVGFLAGSRRFWVVAPLAVAAIFAVASSRHGHGRGRVASSIGWIGLVSGTALLAAFLALRDQMDLGRVASTGWNLQVRLLTLLDPGGGFGLDSRIARWNLSLDMLNGPTFWLGSGFDYLITFGCKFSGCGAVDYPHNLLLSSMLYGGIAGLTSVAVLSAYLLTVAAKLARRCPEAQVFGVLMIAYVPFVFVSSNSVFSVKSFLATGALCALAYRYAPDK